MGKYTDLKRKIKKAESNKITRKSVDLTNLSIREAQLVNKFSIDTAPFSFGAGCKRLNEPIPNFIEADCEKVIQGENNACIVLGRDRPGSRFSGYGGRGHTQCGSIDIVSGRAAKDAASNLKDGTMIGTEPDFGKDAARIYISQKTDIDKNFNLKLLPNEVSSTKNGKVERFSDARSGIGLKADCIRIMGRQDIKICTGMDDKNSQGGDLKTVGTISLIAGNYDGVENVLQPIAKAGATAAAFMAILELINQLRTTMNGLVEIQKKYNKALSTHTHFSPFYGQPTSTSYAAESEGKQAVKNHYSRTIMGLEKIGVNLETMAADYLESSSPLFIGSRQVKTT